VVHGLLRPQRDSWSDELSLAIAALKSPADQPAKRAFIEDLKAKYGTIEKLNDAWGTNHAGWDVLLSSIEPPDKTRARDDLGAFYTRTAETYFRTIREELKAVAPDQLYLGCRFAWVNDRAARAGAKYCDVVSYNRYEYGVEDLRLPDGCDKPVVIGEFHFGALDRGMFHTGLRRARDQRHRADLYAAYVRGALRHPLIVGTHWFQYQDQATTGRGDGENYQIGFLDICDTPYPEIIAAARDIGARMYDIRHEAGPRRAGRGTSTAWWPRESFRSIDGGGQSGLSATNRRISDLTSFNRTARSDGSPYGPYL